MKRAELAETAAVLRRVLDAVAAGELEATTPRARALVRRLEGAAAALEAVESGPRPPAPDAPDAS